MVSMMVLSLEKKTEHFRHIGNLVESVAFLFLEKYSRSFKPSMCFRVRADMTLTADR